MDKQTLTIVAPIFVAAAGGFAVVAYRHPVSFERMFGKLMLFVFAGIYSLTIWGIGGLYAWQSVRKFIAPEHSNEASAAFHETQPENWMFGVFIAIAVFFFALSLLPWLLRHDKKNDQ